MRRRFALVFNAKAGLAVPRLLDSVLGHLRSAGSDVFQLPARSAEEARDRVRESAVAGLCDAVIAAGGDGTLRAVASGLSGTHVPVGMIPLGTGNVFRYEVGLPRSARGLADTLLEGPEVVAEAGLVNGEAFFLMAGAGFDAQIVSRLGYRTKRVLGRAAYTGPVLKSLAGRPQLFDVSIDGRMFQASWVIFTKSSRYGGAFRLTDQTQIGVNRLVAYIVEGTTRRDLLHASAALGLGRLARPETLPSFVSVVDAHEATVGLHAHVPVQVDGDAFGVSPITINAAGPSVRFIVPPAHVADLTNRHPNHVVSHS